MDCGAIEFQENRVIIKKAKNFNIKQTFECGQCFRWEKINDNNFIGVAYGRVLEVIQEGENIILENTNKEEFENIWRNYFDLDRDYSVVKEKLSKDKILKEAVEFGYGIRVLNQEPFELVISFIISARNSIPVISRTIKEISKRWGEKIEYKGKEYYSFPTVEKLAGLTEEELKDAGGSFRSKYIVNTSKKINDSIKIKEGKLDIENKEEFLENYDLERIINLDDDDCHKALQNYAGIGAKVADCIMLFSMGKISAFPVDRWVQRAMVYFYNAEESSLNKMREFARDRFKEVSGFVQQYLFYYVREKGIKI